MTHPLSSLLYYDLSTIKHGKISKAFKEYRLLLNALIEAIDAFEEGDLEKFDSLVGENACQIRAIRVALIHTNNSLSKNLKNRAIQVQEEISEILNNKVKLLEHRKLSLKEIFEDLSCEIFLNEDDIFLLASYLLTEMKETFSSEFIISSLEMNEKGSPAKIKRFDSDISYSFGSKLTSHLRKNLSKSSVKFVQEIASHLQNPELSLMVSDEFSIEHNALTCTPMYWTYKTLINTAEIKQIPIIVNVKFTRKTSKGYIITSEKKLIFKPIRNLEGTLEYKKACLKNEDLKKAACVIEGFANCVESHWDEKHLTVSVKDMILAGAADHRQYPNSKICPIVENSEHNYFKDLAKNKGFSKENPSTFFIQHVFPSQVNRFLLNR
jgi:hypothetical protein